MKEYIITLHIGIAEGKKVNIKDFDAFLNWTANHRSHDYTEEQVEQQDREYTAFISGMHKSQIIGYIEATPVEEDVDTALEQHKKALNNSQRDQKSLNLHSHYK